MVQERPVRVERRLSAILAADVAGYSRLMHSDEEATHAKLTALLMDAVNPMIAEHGGRIVKNTGDGFLAEFPSAVEAVRAAILFQTRIHELTTGDAEDTRLRLRVGINIGDVIIEPHDIFGDGVNIAARLEGIAEPGSICISSSAYDQVVGKITVEFVDLGEQRLKAATDRSYHGGSFRGGYGHGLAADVVSVKGTTRVQRWISTESLWKWIDAHGKDFGIGRPYLDKDPPHVAPIDGKEYAAHHRGTKSQHAGLDMKRRKRLAVRDDHGVAKRPKTVRSSKVRTI
jgi:hypothetical protein